MLGAVANEEIPDDLDEMSWSEIQSVVAKVKYQLDNSSDGAAHQLLNGRLNEAREALAEIEARWDEDQDDSPLDDSDADAVMPTLEEADTESDDSIDELLAELLVDEGDAEESSPDPEVIEAAITTARGKPRSRVSGAAASHPTDRQSVAADRHEGTGRPDGVGMSTQRFTTASWLIGAFVLAALIGTVGLLLVGSPGSSDNAEAADDVEGADQAAAAVLAEPAGDLDEFREVLDVLDAGRLDVGWEGTVLRISGTVASTDQLKVVRDTAAVMVDYGELDTSDVIVDEPLIAGASTSATASAAATAPATAPDGPAPKLQRDLGRLLRTTPIMFEPGESELGELDRRILNAAVALILSAPEAAIMITGHPDEAGAGRGDADLATARATAVRDYLIVRGIDPEVLSSNGRATLDPDGAPGAIELIVDADRSNP